MTRISVREFAVVSATAVTAVGSVVGVSSADSTPDEDTTPTAVGATLLEDIPVGRQARAQTASLGRQAEVQAVAADVSALKDAEATARKAAAEKAVAKKESARQAAEARKRAQEQEAAEGDTAANTTTLAAQSSYSTSQVQAMARQMVPSGQWQCFSNIVDHESSWNYRAVNASSGAYGLFQALPGSKMSSVGADWQTNPATQIKWGLNYMNGSYGSPCGAWSFWQANHWY
ncbi:hypothetical protein GCM10010330_79600 [Streptomyces tendae]|uniref:aggregation-promoting factor C-terminal-like domain-containing protein n=1 Tax=Streptomyces tendae TaxID=1932 RepID=UPI001679A684|nr:transglycosylase SLT domain-containing protein [Streptomyces tendae]GHB13837.1 hypothetical protein GCM10010330_79600 [Streptomyces tendae]